MCGRRRNATRCMPSDPQAALADIAEHIHLARLWCAPHSLESFSEDRKTFYAVTRCLSVISEAVKRLPPAMQARHPDLPWRQIRDAGNVYRHQYDDVLERDVWDTVQYHLGGLERVVEAEQTP